MANNRPTPPLHLVLIVVCAVLTLASMFFYFFAPADKQLLFHTVITLLIGFITGKLTNSFGEPLSGNKKDRNPEDV